MKSFENNTPFCDLKWELFLLTKIVFILKQPEKASLLTEVTASGISIEVKLEILEKSVLSIEVVEEGIVTEISLEQFKKALSSIVVEEGIVTEVSLEQFKKALSSIEITDPGILRAVSLEQDLKAN